MSHLNRRCHFSRIRRYDHEVELRKNSVLLKEAYYANAGIKVQPVMGAGSKPAWQSRALNRSINASSEKRNEIGDPSNKTSLLKNLDANYRHYPRKIRAERDAKLQLAHESRPESPLQSRRYHAHHRYSVSRTRIDKSLCYSISQSKHNRNNRNNLSLDQGRFRLGNNKAINNSPRKIIPIVYKQRNDYNNKSISEIEKHLIYYGCRLFTLGRTVYASYVFQGCLQRNPTNMDCHYYMAMCKLSQHDYRISYDILKNIIDHQPNYPRRSLYLFTAVAAKHLCLLDMALYACNEGTTLYADYVYLINYKAGLFELQKNYQYAQRCYESSLKIVHADANIHYQHAECLKNMGLLVKCINSLTSALEVCGQGKESKDLMMKVLKKRFAVYLGLEDVSEARKDLKKLVELIGNTSYTAYLSGLLFLKYRRKKYAILSFYRSLRIASDMPSMRNSLIYITKCKIDYKDFYSASQHISRCKFLNLHSKYLIMYKLFTDGVVSLMKRKITDGVAYLTQMLDNGPLDSYFEPIFYLYRAYGHFMANRHDLAIKDYQIVDRLGEKDIGVYYNMLLAEGIEAIHCQYFDYAIMKFNKAYLLLKSQQRIYTYIYRAITMLERAKTTNCPFLPLTRESYLQIHESLEELDKACAINDSNSNLYYIKALLFLFLNQCEEGLEGIVNAITKSYENIAKYFFIRALANACLYNNKSALSDLNVCINLDSTHSRAYFYRAKLQFRDNSKKAMYDILKLKYLQPYVDEYIHLASLSYVHGDYDEAYYFACRIQYTYTKTSSTTCVQLVTNGINLSTSALETKMALMVNSAIKKCDYVCARALCGSLSADRMICDVILGRYECEKGDYHTLKHFSIVQYHNYLGIKYFKLKYYQAAIIEFTSAAKAKIKYLADFGETIDFGEALYTAEYDYKYSPIRNLVKNTSYYSQQHIYQMKGSQYYCIPYDFPDEEEQQRRDNETYHSELSAIRYNLCLAYLKNGELRKAYSYLLKENFGETVSAGVLGSLKQLILYAMKSESTTGQTKVVFFVQFLRNRINDTVYWVDIELPNFILRTKLCYLYPYYEYVYYLYLPGMDTTVVLDHLRVQYVDNRPEPPWVKRIADNLVFTDEVVEIDVSFYTTYRNEEEMEEDEEETTHYNLLFEEIVGAVEDVDNNHDRSANEHEEGYKILDGLVLEFKQTAQKKLEEHSENKNMEKQQVKQEQFDPRKFISQIKLRESVEKKLDKIIAPKQQPAINDIRVQTNWLSSRQKKTGK